MGAEKKRQEKPLKSEGYTKQQPFHSLPREVLLQHLQQTLKDVLLFSQKRQHREGVGGEVI